MTYYLKMKHNGQPLLVHLYRVNLKVEDIRDREKKTAVLNILRQKNKFLQLKDHLIHLIVHYLMMTLLPQIEDMVKDQLEINLIGKKLVLRNSELLDDQLNSFYSLRITELLMSDDPLKIH